MNDEEDIKMNSSLLEIPPSPRVTVIMSARKKCIHLCEHVNHCASRFLCMIIIIGQVHYLDYLLVFYSQSSYWWFILIPDWIAICLFFAHFTKSYRHFVRSPKPHEAPWESKPKTDSIPCREGHDKSYFPWWPLAWLIYSLTISIKIIVLFTMTPEESIELWETKTIQGATGMQTAVGITSVIFFLMLISNIHRSVNGKMKSFIHEVSATVTIDLLDTMDLLELLYEEEEKHARWEGNEEIIFRLVLAIVVINMLVPVFPCAIIHRGRTHTSHMFRRLVLIQKVLQIVLVNLLFMSVRLVLWSMFSEKFSAFIIKNVLMVGILSTDIFNVYMEMHEEKRREHHQKKYYDTIMGVAAPVKTKTVNGESVEFEMKEVQNHAAATDLNGKSTLQKQRYSIFCDNFNQFFSRFLCLAILIGQTHYLDYLLISYIQTSFWWTIFIPDWTSVIIFFIYHAKAYKCVKTHTQDNISINNKSTISKCDAGTNTSKKILFHQLNIKSKIYFPWGPVAWFLYGTVTSVKIIIIFTSENYGQKWNPGTTRSKNGMQIAIGLTSIIFFLLLMSSMHSSVQGKIKRFIHEVSATVPIDLLDTMDLLEIMYIEEKEHHLWNGYREIIVRLVLGIIVINMLVPVFPCTIVYQGWTHESHIFRHLVLVQKVLQIVLVNIFFMSIRLVLWSVFHEKFSAFIIKNILMVGILSSDIFSVFKEAHWDKTESLSLKSVESDASEVSKKSEMEPGAKVFKSNKKVINSDENTITELINTKMINIKETITYV